MEKRSYSAIVGSICLTLLLVVVLLPACAAEQRPTSFGDLEVRATDAPPMGVSNIWITTDNISVHNADDPEDTWITVIGEEVTFDLVAIAGTEVSLGEEQVATGNYTQIRVSVSEVIVTLDSENITAKLPSEKLKVVRPWEVREGEKTILSLDFDAEKFVVITGKRDAIVKPVLKLEITHGERPLKVKKK